MSENIEIEDYKIRLIGNQGVGKTIFSINYLQENLKVEVL